MAVSNGTTDASDDEPEADLAGAAPSVSENVEPEPDAVFLADTVFSCSEREVPSGLIFPLEVTSWLEDAAVSCEPASRTERTISVLTTAVSCWE